jgi:hypothetical protein
VQAVRHLVQDVGGLVHPAALLAGCRPHLAERLPEAERAPAFARAGLATAICGAVVRPRRFKSSSRSRHDCELSHRPSVKPTSSLLAFRRRADDDQDALRLLLEPGLQMDAVGPAINVALS